MLLATLAGCVQAESEPPPFRLNMTQVSANQLVPAHQQAIADILEAMFGTPDKPFALPETGLDLRKLQMAAGPSWSDQKGTKHGLYRRNCAHCHGISGGGDGPTALIRESVSARLPTGRVQVQEHLQSAESPTDEDLHQVLMNGVPGTSMPSFSVLPPDEVSALLEYVKYLAMRGQMETSLVNFVVDNLDYDPVTGEAAPLDIVNDPDQREESRWDCSADDVVAKWEAANEMVVVPAKKACRRAIARAAEVAASVAAGRALFYGTKANCVKCHGPTGLGDGTQDDYDIWSKAVVTFEADTESLESSIAIDKKNLAELDGDELATAAGRVASQVSRPGVA